MKYKLVADSSSNILSFSGVDFASVPLKIITNEKEYVDDAQLNVAAMVEDLKVQTGPSRSSCPNMQEWLDAFEGADAIFAIAITSNLSGSYSTALHASQEYEAAHPGARVCVLDSLSTGPEMRLALELIRDRIAAGDSFDEIEAAVRAYMKRTHLFFTLRSMNNLARNGRVNPAVAKIASVLGICVVGKASDQGTLQQLHKCRGEKKAMRANVDEMRAHGFSGGKAWIDHCQNPEIARQLKKAILAEWPGSRVEIGTCGALCSFYAEDGGYMIGFEGAE